jgi:H+-transporting ATPase
MNLLNPSDIETKEKVEADVARFGEMGIRCMAIAKKDMKDGKDEWKMMGLLTFLDPPRPDTKQTILDANKYGTSNAVAHSNWLQGSSHGNISLFSFLYFLKA